MDFSEYYLLFNCPIDRTIRLLLAYLIEVLLVLK
jgi:hypothetical protein